ncbi:MAG: class I SAM-dependent DNA methyltransferase [Prevotellaceae bacterium]|nr:class I SAM-dependent DNA methyltransferase [Candidatus Minthosoma caballi]
MAKKNQLSYKDIESNLRVLKDGHIVANNLGYQILKAFGKGDREIERMKDGKGVVSTFDGLLVKNEFCYKASTTLLLAGVLEELKNDTVVLRANPKIIAVSDGKTIRAYDLRKKDSFEQQVARLYCDFEFFYPLAGVERIEYVEESEADIKAAEKLAKLHDEIRAYNEFTSDSDLHDLNTFIARLLFCFFAEDTGIFPSNSFTRAIKQFTHDSTNLKEVLEQLFRFMGGRPIPMGMLQTYCNNNFAYVGGGLFERDTYIPMLSNKARQIIIDSGELDWENINPDIFGSMIQAVVNPDVRANQGMHYTSVPNIMKVINPLFLDELRGEYTALSEEQDKVKKQKDVGMLSQSQFLSQCKPIEKKCRALLLRMSKMKFFDPACGSGNFLIITYKMLRLLEMDILSLIGKCNPQGSLQFIDGSVISIQQFYGIELLDFPHESAMLSLWLAEHQMNKKMREDFGVNTKALPLKEITQIKCGNACRLDWNVVCPHTKDEEVYVFGNPPYLGARLQDESQKADMAYVFGNIKGYNNLDYIACWFMKGANFINETTELAFVTTNSISQGEQVPILWPQVFKHAVIRFAYSSFKWTNNAKYNAGVTCTIIGMCGKNKKVTKSLFTDSSKIETDYINAYLSKGTNVIVESRKTPLVEMVPNIQFGSMPNDGGHLLLTSVERELLINSDHKSGKFIHRFYGSEEFINDIEKYCLWIEDSEVNEALQIVEIKKRVDACRETRVSSKREATKKLSIVPYRFGEVRHEFTDKIIMPRVSSERRPYIPIGFLNSDDVISDSAFAIYDAPIHLFGIITSRIHMDWVRTVGGRLETRYRYSAGLCYNTFPFPNISDTKKQEIEDAATDILLTREPYLTIGKTLADLYDPDTMPPDLKAAHERLDDIVESCYPGYPFANDEARLECLFKMYEKMTKR